MNTLATVLTLLRREATSAEWAQVLAQDVVFETLGVTLQGRDEVAARLAEFPHAKLEWNRLERPGVVLAGTARPGTRDRGLVISLELPDQRIERFSQQNTAVVPQPDAPMVMNAELRGRFDQALARKHPMTLAYVDRAGRPHVSLRGSLRTFAPDRLCLWVRNSEHGFAADIRHNPHVALLFRDESTRATYQMRGRAYVAEDEVTRRAVYAGLPLIERQHDFARLGAAVLIELDLVEGYAGLGPSGQIDPVRLVRAPAATAR